MDQWEYIETVCEFQVSENCDGTQIKARSGVRRNRLRNSGKYICLACSRKLKGIGRNNPNCKYKDIDDNLFENIDSEEKAYLLGWIASDGSLSETCEGHSKRFTIHTKDKNVLIALRNIISNELPIKEKNYSIGNSKEIIYNLTVCSNKMIDDICDLLNINPGKKCFDVDFPKLSSNELTWAFIRGLFDGDGCITDPYCKKKTPRCIITSSSEKMINGICEFIPMTYNVYEESNKTTIKLELNNSNCLDFLGKLYDNAKIYLSRKRDLYYDWCSWVPSLAGNGNHGNDILFRWTKTLSNAVAPSKTNITDSGYDLTIVEIKKQMGTSIFYNTGIKIQPTHGYYFDIVPRSSITKLGYMLVNSVGIIDRGYTGEILVVLTKIDQNAPDLELPCRIAQMIPRPIIHGEIEEVDELLSTVRGDKGYGSTGR